MSPIASHRKQTLIINYTDASGAAGSLNFELPAYRATDAQETIAAKKSPVPSYAAAAASNEWWGDSVWKTKRNKAAWDAEAAKNAQAAEAAAERCRQPARPAFNEVTTRAGNPLRVS